MVFEKTKDILTKENESLKQQIDDKNQSLVEEQNKMEKELADFIERNQKDKNRLE